MRGQRRETFQVVHQAAALCLGYPEREIIASAELVRAAIAEKAPRQAESFESLLAFWDSSELGAIQTHYVDVFDLSRKHSLYLSYWTDGDTRRRGEVLAAFKQRYRRSGFLVDTGGELPDYLPMVLEYAAIVDPVDGTALLQEYRSSVELLRLALVERGTAYAGVLTAVAAPCPVPRPLTARRSWRWRRPALRRRWSAWSLRTLDSFRWEARDECPAMGVLPYVMMAILIGGLIWRYRYDQFGWTTRSSQLYESRLLRIGSPLFHFGILVVIIGHLGGLVIPKSWTKAVGITDGIYHFNALLWGTLAGLCTLVGILILIYRRRTTGPVFMATTKNDKVMYVVLVAAIVAGLATTVLSVFGGHEEATYRDTVLPWFRSLFYFSPKIDSMAAAPLAFQMHTLIGMLLFAIWPFTRLVHAFTVPLHYLFRPYIVYRSRDDLPAPGAAPTHRGWAPVGTRDRTPGA